MTGSRVPLDPNGPRVIHESDRATVVHGDARDYMAGMATESVDLVVVDPPYGVEWRSGFRQEAFDTLHGDGAGERDGVRQILEGCVRVVGQHRHLYVFGPTDVVEGLKTTAPVPLVWAKQVIGAGDLSSPWGPQHEPISFLVSKHRHAGKAGRDNSLAARLRKGSVLHHPRPTGRNVRHPSEKPVSLLVELVESSSVPDELVFDPCAGSGSTGVAAILRGRRCLLVESHEPYALIAADRVREAEAIIERAEAA